MSKTMSKEAKQMFEKALKLSQESPPDFEAAFKNLLDAHEANSGEASYALGSWYLHGRHVEHDISTAVEYWLSGAKLNNIDSLTELAKYYENEEYCCQDMSKSLGYYIKAALLGDAASMYDVGRIYYHGIGVNEDKFIAEVWLNAADENGYDDEKKGTK